jgi:hypothetical protein
MRHPASLSLPGRTEELSWIEALAERCAAARTSRYLLFVAATVCSVLFAGYYFGTFDQAIHIPFLKKFADPSLYPNDPFFDLRLRHYSFFWFPFIWAYRAGALEVAMFAVHLLVTYATFWALWELSWTMFRTPLASLLAVATFVVPHAGFAGFTLIEFSLLNRTFVLPFLLVAINLYLRQRPLLAFFTLGVLYNLHVVSVNFVLAMLLFDSLWQIRRTGWRTLVGGVALFVIAALPVLLWWLSAGGGVRGPQWEWFSLLWRSYFYHLFFLIGPFPMVVLVTLGGCAAVVLFIVARRAAPPPPAIDRSVANFMIAALLIVAVQAAISYVYPITILIQSQIMRAGVFAMLFAYLYVAHALAEGLRSGRLARGAGSLLIAATVLLPSPLFLLIVGAITRWVRPARLARVLGWGVTAASFVGIILVASALGIWRPRIHIFPEQSAWADTQLWARDNTPRDTVFITPPQRWWFYDLEWRVLSERSTVATLSELLEAAFAPEYIPRWRERFEAVAPGAQARMRGDVFENNDLAAAAFYSLSTGELQQIGRRYGATYLVMEKPHTRDLPVAYENVGFIVYRLDATPEPFSSRHRIRADLGTTDVER